MTGQKQARFPEYLYIFGNVKLDLFFDGLSSLHRVIDD